MAAVEPVAAACPLCCPCQGYLNYQVIHHLFPSMPQCYGPLVSPELRAKAKEWGITYTTVSCTAFLLVTEDQRGLAG